MILYKLVNRFKIAYLDKESLEDNSYGLFAFYRLFQWKCLIP